MSSYDNLFGMHTQALALWQRRAEVLSSNLANADTPGYLARDVDFRTLLSGSGGAGGTLALDTTSPDQIQPGTPFGVPLSYQVPTQPSMDGNTVDSQVEKADFAANSVHYQASLAFITAQVHMLRTAITGSES